MQNLRAAAGPSARGPTPSASPTANRPSTIGHPTTRHRADRLVLLLLAAFAALGMWYSLVVPPFETPDELYHYAFARHLALGNSLPVQTVEDLGPWEHEGTQAPLYYLLLSRLIAGIDHRDFDEIAVINPRANLGDPHYPGNKNFILYSGDPAPLTGTVLAVLLGRWFSLLLVLCALWFTYRTARLAFGPTAAAVAASAFVAAIPQLAFIGASVSNDALIILTSTVAVYWMCVLLVRPATRRPYTRDWAILGVLLALAALSKLQGLGLYAPAGVVMLYLAWRHHSLRVLLEAGLIVGALGLALAGWWYLRNFWLYGDPLATRTLLEIEGLRTTPHSFEAFWGELRGLRYSFWGLFGWFSILFPTWIYWILDILTAVALGGLVDLARRRPRQMGVSWLAAPVNRVYALLACWLLILLAALLYWLTFAISSQGRLLLPALSAVAILFTLGLGHAYREIHAHVRRIIGRIFGQGIANRALFAPHPVAGVALLPIGLTICSLYAVIHLLPGQYARPDPLAQLPPEAIRVHRVYGGIIELVALSKPSLPIAPESTIEVTLYLRKLQETGQDYELFVQLLDHEIREIANVTTHPGWGTNPTSLWKIGAIYPDAYELYVHLPLTRPSPAGGDDAPFTTLEARLFVGFRTEDYMLLEVPGYAWDIDSMTVGRIQVVLD